MYPAGANQDNVKHRYFVFCILPCVMSFLAKSTSQ